MILSLHRRVYYSSVAHHYVQTLSSINLSQEKRSRLVYIIPGAFQRCNRLMPCEPHANKTRNLGLIHASTSRWYCCCWSSYYRWKRRFRRGWWRRCRNRTPCPLFSPVCRGFPVEIIGLWNRRIRKETIIILTWGTRAISRRESRKGQMLLYNIWL